MTVKSDLQAGSSQSRCRQLRCSVGDTTFGGARGWCHLSPPGTVREAAFWDEHFMSRKGYTIFNARFHKTCVIETESSTHLGIDRIFQYAFEFHEWFAVDIGASYTIPSWNVSWSLAAFWIDRNRTYGTALGTIDHSNVHDELWVCICWVATWEKREIVVVLLPLMLLFCICSCCSRYSSCANSVVVAIAVAVAKQ